MMKVQLVFVLSFSLLITNCGGNSRHMPVTDILTSSGPSTTNASTGAAITYKGNIYPIFQKNCSACHGSGSSHGDWLDYSQAYQKRDLIFQHVTVDRIMPMAPFDKIISEEERSLIGRWVTAGAPLGSDVSPLPTPILSPTPTGTPVQEGTITYRATIYPIFQKNCFACHGPGSALGDWSDYEHAFAKRVLIFQHVTVDRIMPMAPFDKIISEQERNLIGQWVTAGAPIGDVVLPSPSPVPSGTPDATPTATPGPSSTPIQPLALTYRGAIYPILQKSCFACHGPGSALGAWSDYNQAYNKRALIFQHVTVDRIMPMAPFDKIITEQERSLIGQWVTAGAPLGDGPMPTPTVTPSPTPVSADPPLATSALDTALDQAVIDANVNQVNDLLKQGANPNLIDKSSGLTALMLALKTPNLTIIKALIAKGADTHLKLLSGASVISIASQIQDSQTKSQVAELLNADLSQTGDLYFPTYTKNIKSIFVARCIECHNPNAFPAADWTSFPIIFAKKDLIYNRVIVKRDMPFQNMTNMTRNEMNLMGKWLMSGAAE